MKVVASLRTLSDGALLAATATTLVQPAGATSSSSGQCSTQFSACDNDATCTSCSDTFAAEYDTCSDAISVAGLESSTEYCSVLTDRVCCLVLVSDLECLDSDLFTEAWLCFLEFEGCPMDDLTCASNGSVSDDGSEEESSSGNSTDIASSDSEESVSASSDSEESLIGASNGAGSAGVGHPPTTAAVALSCVLMVLLSLVWV